MLVLEMTKLTFADIKSALGVDPVINSAAIGAGEIAGFEGVSTDSRKINRGDLFFALSGDRFDGHDFLGRAIDAGAAGVVVSQEFTTNKAAVFKVNDTLKALGDLAKAYRNKFNLPCLALTGSNGKTTTKEMLAACASAKYKTFKTVGNFNNLIGLPLSLFNLDSTYEAAVLELGMSEIGEITRLAEISSPQFGVFTNIAPVHLESMGTIENVAKAKFELVQSLPEDGVVVLNADDRILSSWIGKIRQRVITYGIDNDADIKIGSYQESGDGRSTFKIGKLGFTINFPGLHNIYNAACAIAASSALAIDMAALMEPLANMKPVYLRSDIFTADGVTFINDCYNANPVSMKAAIDVLAGFPTSGKRVAVLGDMLELGKDEVRYHREIGGYLSQKNIDALLTFGPLANHYLDTFDGAYKKHFDNKTKLAAAVKDYIQPGDAVLIKGSRGIALEEVSKLFKGEL